MKNIYSVTQITNYIKNMFSQDYMLSSVSVRGEISNLKYHSSGHIYFSMKDENALISCVMFASDARSLSFRLEDGAKVVVSGSVSVYSVAGKYQIYAKKIEKEGHGDLAAAFLELKTRLEEMGLFAPEYKKPIPFFAKKVGIITAPTGAAVRDIINISRRRNPFVQLILYPATVQGDQAVVSLIKGIRAMEEYSVDVIIIGRGGGSIEDLWAFNEEAVAQAIFDCSIPIISAVGHETDTTISDYVADLRAPTPSAAAELAVADVGQILSRLSEDRRRLDFHMRTVLDRYRLQTKHASEKLLRFSPEGRLRSRREKAILLEEKYEDLINERIREKRRQLENIRPRLDELLSKKLQNRRHYLEVLQERLHAPDERIRRAKDLSIAIKEKSNTLILEKIKTRRMETLRMEQRFPESFEKVFNAKKHRFEMLLARYKSCSPLDRLNKGYIFASDQDGNALSSAAALQKGDRLKLQFKDGTADVSVESVTGRKE